MPRAALPLLLLVLAGPAQATPATASSAGSPAETAPPAEPGQPEPAQPQPPPPGVPAPAPDDAAATPQPDAGAAHADAPVAAPALPLPPTMTHLAVSGVLGRTVAGPDRRDIGRVVDVLVDGSGVPRAAVIDFGGFMGLGSRKIAVEWAAFSFPPGGSDAVLTIVLSPEQIKDTPEYAGTGKPVAVVGPGTPVPRPGP